LEARSLFDALFVFTGGQAIPESACHAAAAPQATGGDEITPTPEKPRKRF